MVPRSLRRAGVLLALSVLPGTAAAQLNERFRRSATPADPAAWASWMAVKVLWESVARTGTTEPAELR
ncbi:MAG TPA: hypothetical protein VHG08_18575, partial [Longimicrobium sp.]|nr:hypothetical protein [Longimicrobium sp.]